MLVRIAIRNILRHRRRSLITLAVISFGALGLILFGGYKARTFTGLREGTIRTRLGHLQVFHLGYSRSESRTPMEYSLSDVASLRKAVEQDPRVRTTAAQITLVGLISNGNKSGSFMATAVEPVKDREMRSHRLVSGTHLPGNEIDAVILGRGLAASMDAKPGDYLTILTTTTTGALNAMDVRVAGVFMSGVKEYDDRAVKMPLEGAQRLLQTDKVEKLLVFLNDTDDTTAVQASLRDLFAARKWQLEMKAWSELATFYHQVVRLYNGIFGFLRLIVFALVVFSVANAIVMSTFERMREIGTLMAIGTTRNRVGRMFLLEGLFLGLTGGLIGIAAGALVAAVINNGEFMLPPPPGYTIGFPLRILLQPQVLVGALILSAFTATLSSVLPAFRASRIKIVDALGHF